MDLTTARAKKKLTQSELQKLTGIDQGKLSRIETGRLEPTPKERHLLEKALGESVFEEVTILGKETNEMKIFKNRQEDGSGVPSMPTMRWNKDGSCDFSHLDDDEAKEQEYYSNREDHEEDGVPELPFVQYAPDGGFKICHEDDQDEE